MKALWQETAVGPGQPRAGTQEPVGRGGQCLALAAPGWQHTGNVKGTPNPR